MNTDLLTFGAIVLNSSIVYTLYNLVKLRRSSLARECYIYKKKKRVFKKDDCNHSYHKIHN